MQTANQHYQAGYDLGYKVAKKKYAYDWDRYPWGVLLLGVALGATAFFSACFIGWL